MSQSRFSVPARKAGFLLIGLGLVAIIAAACAPTTAPESPPEADESAGTSVYPQTHTDLLGRVVTLDARPERIISLAPSITEILFAIGAGDQVVGRTEFCNYPPEAEALTVVGGFTSDTISVETILDLEPDLVLAGSIYQADLVETLEGAGLTVFADEPASLAEIEASILTLGEMTDNTSGAEAVAADMQERADAVAAAVAAIPEAERVTVFYEIWHEPLMTTSNATVQGELIALAGGVNIFGDLEEDWPTISAEEIIARDPQVILGPSSHGDQLTADVIAAREGWGDLTAVQEGAIYIVDGDTVSRPGPRVIDALEDIAAMFYPERFAE